MFSSQTTTKPAANSCAQFSKQKDTRYWLPAMASQSLVAKLEVKNFELGEKSPLAELAVDVGVALTRERDLGQILQTCTESMVEHLDAALAFSKSLPFSPTVTGLANKRRRSGDRAGNAEGTR
jgi:hypothetical protein